MKRIHVTGALLMAALAATGCSHRIDLTRESSQIDVGVDAAKMNLWREALFRFQRAVQIDPNDAMAHNNLAVAYEGTGDFEKARANYIEALRLDKSNEYIQKNFSRFTEFTSRNKKRGRAAITAPKSTKATSSAPSSTASRPAAQPEGGAPPSVSAPAGTAPSSAPPSGSPAIPSTGSPAPAPASPPTPPPPKLPGGSR